MIYFHLSGKTLFRSYLNELREGNKLFLSPSVSQSMMKNMEKSSGGAIAEWINAHCWE